MKRISQLFTLGLIALTSFASHAESASEHASKGSRHSAHQLAKPLASR